MVIKQGDEFSKKPIHQESYAFKKLLEYFIPEV